MSDIELGSEAITIGGNNCKKRQDKLEKVHIVRLFRQVSFPEMITVFL